MSKTFASIPPRSVRGRGSGRGTATATGPPASGLSSMSRNNGGRVPSRVTPSGASGRSQPFQPPNKSRPTARPSLIGERAARERVGGRGNMNDPYSRNDNPGPAGRGFTNEGGEGMSGQGSDMAGQGQYAGGYTMFSPNEKRRQQVNEMARKETEAYERYKQANARKTYNYVGTVGGGEINQDQVRARQANQVRAQKFNRQMKQENYREQRKKAEEDAIQTKRNEARRKADLNAQRQEKVSAEEIRRKREAFLAQLESQQPRHAPDTNQADFSPSPTHGNLSNSPNRPVPAAGSWNNFSRVSAGASNDNYNNSNYSGGRNRYHSPDDNLQASRGNNFHWGSGSNNQGQQHAGRSPVKEEPGHYGIGAEVKREPEHNESVEILMSIYPTVDPVVLAEIYDQMGSLEAAVDCLSLQN